MTHAFDVGDWVRIHKAGIWQIYRLLNVKCADPRTGEETQRPILFAKRFLSNSFRKSFSQDCCHPSLARPLTDSEKQKLNAFIEQHDKQFAQFEAFTPKPIGCIYNARMAIPSDKTPEQVDQELSTDRTFNELQIRTYLEGHGFDDGFPYWTVQFKNSDHECDDDGYLRYTYMRVLGHV